MAPGQLAEKVNFACEAGVCNPFFASALPRQKTLAGMFRRKSHFSDFFDGLRPGTEMAPGRFYEFGTLDYSLEIASLSSLIRVSMVAKFSSRS